MARGDLIDDIERAIGALQRTYRSYADESDLYEASLLVLCIEAARAAGGTILLTDDGTRPATNARFRRGPGNLWSPGFTYARATFPDTTKVLEVHLGVFVTAAGSRVAHECDVAILDHDEAERSRQAAVHPRSGRKLIAVIEAKHYSASPSLGVGRAFLGLAQEFKQDKCSLVFPSRSSANLAGLIAKRSSEVYGELMAGNQAAERLRSRLDQAIRNWKAEI